MEANQTPTHGAGGPAGPDESEENVVAFRPPQVRLSVNLASDVARVLRELAASRSISITEAIRRAITVWKYLEDEQAAGRKLAVIEEHGDQTTLREVVLL